MKFRPSGDRIVIRQLAAASTTKGGIFIPEQAKEKPCEGEVLAVGPGRILDNGNEIPVCVKPGDVVLYSKYGGTTVRIEDEDYLIVREPDVLGVLDKSAS